MILITRIIRVIVLIIGADGGLRHGHDGLLGLIVVLIVAGLVMGGIGELIRACFVVVFDFHPPGGILGGNFGYDFVAFGLVGGDGDKSVAELVELSLGVSLFNSM